MPKVTLLVTGRTKVLLGIQQLLGIHKFDQPDLVQRGKATNDIDDNSNDDNDKEILPIKTALFSS